MHLKFKVSKLYILKGVFNCISLTLVLKIVLLNLMHLIKFCYGHNTNYLFKTICFVLRINYTIKSLRKSRESQ